MQRRGGEETDPAAIADQKSVLSAGGRIRKLSECHENGNFRRAVFPEKENPVFRQLLSRKRFARTEEFHLPVDRGGKRGRSDRAFEREIRNFNRSFIRPEEKSGSKRTPVDVHESVFAGSQIFQTDRPFRIGPGAVLKFEVDRNEPFGAERDLPVEVFVFIKLEFAGGIDPHGGVARVCCQQSVPVVRETENAAAAEACSRLKRTGFRAFPAEPPHHGFALPRHCGGVRIIAGTVCGLPAGETQREFLERRFRVFGRQRLRDHPRPEFTAQGEQFRTETQPLFRDLLVKLRRAVDVGEGHHRVVGEPPDRRRRRAAFQSQSTVRPCKRDASPFRDRKPSGRR